MEILKMIHSFWAYLVVLAVAVATINALMGYLGKKEYHPKDFRIALFTLIVTHIQLLIGLIIYFVSPLGLQSFSTNGMSEVMGNSLLRLYAVEHPLMMIITVVFITVGYSKHKTKLVSGPKFKMLAVFYTLGLLCLLSRIPWSQWF
jgi:heme/copper-type cytochrome/quinol oxidase subunit 2